ncbi:MAG: hypothetical protein JJU05_11505 [Verrucomicrobia bacterium]|nr:hypothetical protein [Verrucomicrobiota bacterium]MCH8528793.1 hypothetical protein [Kiritimatiellia bacterium]
MNWHEINLTPRDLLFFRDARPMSGGGIGQGGNWPLPHTLHGALHTALYQTLPERQNWETSWHRPKRKVAQAAEKTTDMRFGNLRSVGPFPASEDTVFVPAPRDLVYDQEKEKAAVGFEPVRLPGPWKNDLPSPLIYPVARKGKPSKDPLPAWISLSEFFNYLRGEPVALKDSGELWQVERTVGIALDDRTGATREGMLYQAEKMRLMDDVHFRAFAALAGSGPDVLSDVFQQNINITFGGESSVVTSSGLRKIDQNAPFVSPLKIQGTRVKWTLITPALFRKGWQPAWVDDTGQVCLPAAPCEREPGERREEWRERLKHVPPIAARLVAALLPSPRHVSGWRAGADGGPKKTERLVEAGSVYYFEADTPEQAQLLTQALNGTPRSDSLGEKGYGYGLCSSWTLTEL